MKTLILYSKTIIISTFLFVNYYATIAQNAPKNQVGYSEMGMASYYPSDEASRKTLTGDVYDMKALEAAHRNFPLNCLIRVTNLENGKEITLRVNDRPNTTERIMDMTLAAADSLGMVAEDKAVIPVRTEILALNVLRQAVSKGVLATASSPTKKEVVSPKKETEAKKNIEETKKVVATKKETVAKETPKKEVVAKETVKKETPKVIPAKEKIAPTAKNDKKVVAEKTVPFQEDAFYDVKGKKQKPQGFGVQTGKFSEVSRAISEAQTVEKMKLGKVYIQTSTIDGKKMYSVLVGTFNSKDATKEAVKQLTEKKYSPFAKKY